MYGIIFHELKKYAIDRLGSGGWDQVVKEADLGAKFYLPSQEYPDSDIVALVSAASRLARLPVPTVLEDFGAFIAPTLLSGYKILVRPEWKTFDLLENTEEVIHKVVRVRNPGARPAEIRCVRQGPGTMELTYRSPRKMCAVARGIIRGVATHYSEQVEVTETACMSQGAPACRMTVRLV